MEPHPSPCACAPTPADPPYPTQPGPGSALRPALRVRGGRRRQVRAQSLHLPPPQPEGLRLRSSWGLAARARPLCESVCVWGDSGCTISCVKFRLERSKPLQGSARRPALRGRGGGRRQVRALSLPHPSPTPSRNHCLCLVASPSLSPSPPLPLSPSSLTHTTRSARPWGEAAPGPRPPHTEPLGVGSAVIPWRQNSCFGSGLRCGTHSG